MLHSSAATGQAGRPWQEGTFEVVASARAAGVTIVLIEQFIERALELADSALILRRGRVAWSGAAGEVGADVLDHYLDVDETAVAAAIGEEVP